MRFREMALPFTTALLTTTSKFNRQSTTRTTYEESTIIPIKTPSPSPAFVGQGSLVPKPSSSASFVAQQSAIPGITSHQPQVTTIITVKDGKTYSEAYTAVLFPGYESDKTTKTLTTTDSNGGAVLAVIGIGGLGWLAALPKPGLPVINPPNTPPAPGPESVRTWDGPSRTSTDAKTSTSSSSSSSEEPTGTGTVIIDNIPNIPRKYRDQHLGWRKKRVFNQLKCADRTSDNSYVERDPIIQQIHRKCNDMAGNRINAGSSLANFISYGSGAMATLNITQVEPRLHYKLIDERDCNYFFGRIIDDCDRWPFWAKHGGTIVDADRLYAMNIYYSDGKLQCENNNPTADSGRGLSRDDAEKTIMEFCESKAGTKIGKDTPLETRIEIPEGDSDVVITWKFLPDAVCPKDGTVTIEKEVCLRRLLKRSLDECNTFFQPPFGKYGGKVVDACSESGVKAVRKDKQSSNGKEDGSGGGVAESDPASPGGGGSSPAGIGGGGGGAVSPAAPGGNGSKPPT